MSIVILNIDLLAYLIFKEKQKKICNRNYTFNYDLCVTLWMCPNINRKRLKSGLIQCIYATEQKDKPHKNHLNPSTNLSFDWLVEIYILLVWLSTAITIWQQGVWLLNRHIYCTAISHISAIIHCNKCAYLLSQWLNSLTKCCSGCCLALHLISMTWPTSQV